MRRFEHRLDIAAPVEVVWRLIEVIEEWPSFTPTMTSIERVEPGPLDVGTMVRIKQPWQREAVWTVIEIEPPTRFAWQRQMGPVTITATHVLAATDFGCTQTLAVELAGWGSWLLGAVSGARMFGTLGAENKSFRRRAEEIAGRA